MLSRESSSNDIFFTVNGANFALSRSVSQSPDQRSGDLSAALGLTTLNLSGARIMKRPGIAASLFNSLFQQGINVHRSSISDIKTSYMVAEEAGVQALQVVHAGFGLRVEESHTAQGTPSPQDAF